MKFQIFQCATWWVSTPNRLRALALTAVMVLFNAWCFGTQMVHFETVVKTEYVTAGVGGMRNVGSGTINVSIPTNAIIKSALLYWHGPTNSTDPNANANVVFNGTPITGTNIGFSSDDCWGYVNSQAYRADVTSLVSAGLGQAYALTMFGSSTANPGANTNGASLIVFYDDGNAANYRDVILVNGNDSNFPNNYDPDGWSATFPAFNWSAGTVNLELHAADGQAYPDDALKLNGTVFDPGPYIFQGTSVPGANTGPSSNGNLWDIKDYPIASFLTNGVNSLTLTTGIYSGSLGGGDCLALVAATIDLPTGSATATQTAPPVQLTANQTNTADFSFSNTTGQVVDHNLLFPANTPFPNGNANVNVLSRNLILSDSKDWPPLVIGSPFAPSHLFVKTGDNTFAKGTDLGSRYDDVCYPVGGDPATATDAQCPAFSATDPNPQDVITAKDVFDMAFKPDITPGPASPACVTDACTAALIHFHPTQSESWSPSTTSPNPVCTSPLNGSPSSPPPNCDLANAMKLTISGDTGTVSGGTKSKGSYASVFNVPMLETQVVVNGVAVNTPGRQGSGVVTVPFQNSTGSTVFNLYPAGCFPGPCVTPSAANNYFSPAPVASLSYSISQGANTLASGSPTYATSAVQNQTAHDSTVLAPGQYQVQWQTLDSVGIVEQNISKVAPTNGLCPDGSPAPVGGQCYVTSPFTATFNVGYQFNGFFQPVDNSGVYNSANAGRVIPIKWQVTDGNGVGIANLTLPPVSVGSIPIACPNAAVPTDAIEVYATNASGLINQGGGYYQYNWGTSKGWAGTCRQLIVISGDGVPHTALFQFH